MLMDFTQFPLYEITRVGWGDLAPTLLLQKIVNQHILNYSMAPGCAQPFSCLTKLGTVEGRFADLIWANAPMTTAELVALPKAELDWKRTTAYTVLKRLCDRGLFDLTEGTVTAKISRAEFYEKQSREYVESAFDGSLPAFVAAFSRSRKLRPEEIEALQKRIDESRR